MRRERLPLTTGITLNVALTGPEDAPAAILLHGFPESHRTWRDLAPLLSDKLRLVMPDDATVERVKLMRAYGAEVELTPAAGTIEYSRELALKLVNEQAMTRFDSTSGDWYATS